MSIGGWDEGTLERFVQDRILGDPRVVAALGDARFVPGDFKFAGAGLVPAGWLVCDGAAVSRATYADLFAAVGTAWGAGDGSTTFNVPDLRGRSPIGSGTGTAAGASAWAVGARPTTGRGGEEAHTLSDTESGVPAHSHVIQRTNVAAAAAGADASAVYQASAGTGTTYTSTQPAAAAAASAGHNNVHPVAVVTALIKT